MLCAFLYSAFFVCLFFSYEKNKMTHEPAQVELLGREGVWALAPCPHSLLSAGGIPPPAPSQMGRDKNQCGTVNPDASLGGSEFWFCHLPVAGHQNDGLTLCASVSPSVKS